MKLRNEVETVLRAWHAHETGRGGDGIVDYDCHPDHEPVAAAPDRLCVLARLSALYQRAAESGDAAVESRVRADLAFLRALLGERAPLARYVEDTQGCGVAGWSDDYLDRRRAQAMDSLAAIGVAWTPELPDVMRELEGPLSPREAADAITAAADQLEPPVRALTGTTAPYTLTVESVDVDAYWGFWLDGAGSVARLRLNLRHARFTALRARQFALHEVLGHALQSASYADRCAVEEVPWVRLLSVHAPQQVLLEGLAQALPLFVVPGDRALTARVRLDHYLQLVRARLHLAINSGTTVDDCAAVARALVPFWTGGDIADALADRGANPLLRSYLWAYPAGIDWFVNLADAGDQATIAQILRAAYREPLTPRQLAALWPAGPMIGGK
ncbi:MAG: hypothetical protein QOI74_3523 [Micromonosporaceae bacterium]|nr:hypothetical protein [Micromonosporaceae bacterium]